MDRRSPPAYTDRYVHKDLPPIPEVITEEISIQTRVAQLEQENAALRRLLQSYRSSLDAANDMMRACQQTMKYIRRFRQCQMTMGQDWHDYLTQVRDPKPTPNQRKNKTKKQDRNSSQKHCHASR